MVASAAGLLRVASTAQLARATAMRAAMADELLRAADDPIMTWLAEEAATVALPPDARSPRVTILDDAWEVDGVRFSLVIVGFDQCGMVPIGAELGRSPPADVRRLVDTLGGVEGPMGLDLFVSGPAATVRRVFPATVAGDDPASPLAIGELVATHGTGRLNVNTAPIGLVDAVLRQAGRGGLEQIVAARREGKVFTPGTPRGNGRPPSPVTLEPAGRSDAWAFLVEITVGPPAGAPVCRRWWTVYRSTSTGWKRVQRLADTA